MLVLHICASGKGKKRKECILFLIPPASGPEFSPLFRMPHPDQSPAAASLLLLRLSLRLHTAPVLSSTACEACQGDFIPMDSLAKATARASPRLTVGGRPLVSLQHRQAQVLYRVRHCSPGLLVLLEPSRTFPHEKNLESG